MNCLTIADEPNQVLVWRFKNYGLKAQHLPNFVHQSVCIGDWMRGLAKDQNQCDCLNLETCWTVKLQKVLYIHATWIMVQLYDFHIVSKGFCVPLQQINTGEDTGILLVCICILWKLSLESIQKVYSSSVVSDEEF